MSDSLTKQLSACAQTGVLAAIPKHARYLTFVINEPARARDALISLCKNIEGHHVIGIGERLASALKATVPGLKSFVATRHNTIEVPATAGDLWLWLRATDENDRGDLVLGMRRFASLLAPAFKLIGSVDGFKHGTGRDLTGYEDGTENPKGDAAITAALLAHDNPALNGSSFVAVQQWLHDLDSFNALSGMQQDHSIGRRRLDNEELVDALESAHVRRTAQESFSPPAFVLRRSMPWANDRDLGLMFVAFGASFYAFEAQLRHMMGYDDGIADALFAYTHPISSNYYWCPPVADNRINLAALGL